MFKGQITFDNLTLRYPPSVAQYLMEEIERAEKNSSAANQDPVHQMLNAVEIADYPIGLEA